MKTLLFLFLLPAALVPVLQAKRPVAASDSPIEKIAEPDTPVRALKRANPGAAEVRALRRQNAIHLTTGPGGRNRKAIFGQGLTYVHPDTGAIMATEPVLSTTANGWARQGTAVDIFIRRGGTSDEVEQVFDDPISHGSFSVSLTLSKLVLQQDTATFTYTQSGLAWTLLLRNDGLEMSSEKVATKRGRQTFTFPYSTVGVQLSTQADGSAAGDTAFRVARPKMVGANHQTAACEAWVVEPAALSFTCDDSALSEDFFPYYIDPTWGPTSMSSSGSSPDAINCQNPANSAADICYDSATYQGTVAAWSIGSAWGRYDNNLYLRWDTSSIPSSAIVSGATLKLNAVQGKGDQTNTVHTKQLPIYWHTDNSQWPTTNANSTPWYNISTYRSLAGNFTIYGDCCAHWVTFALTTGASTYVAKGSGYTSLEVGPLNPTAYDDFQDYANPASGGAYYLPTLQVDYTIPNSAPATVSVSGLPENFHYGTWFNVSATVRDPDGYGNLSYWHLLMNYGVDGSLACYLVFYPNSNTLALMNDAGNAWSAGYAMGSGGVVGNSQCQVDATNSSFSNSGTDSTANLRIRFMPGALVRNPQNAYLYVTDGAASAGWAGPYQTGYVRTRPKLIVRQ